MIIYFLVKYAVDTSYIKEEKYLIESESKALADLDYIISHINGIIQTFNPMNKLYKKRDTNFFRLYLFHFDTPVNCHLP